MGRIAQRGTALVAIALCVRAIACTSLGGLSDAPGTGPDGDGAAPGSIDGAAPGSIDGATDASSETIVCPPSERACGTDCVVLTTSQEHCGACNHDCGGGACKEGVCQPMIVRTSIASLSGFAIDGTSVYFGHEDKLSSCPLSGCVAAPAQLASMNTQNVLPPFFAKDGRVLFQSAPGIVTTRPSIFDCPVAGCPATGVPILFGSYIGAIYALAAGGPNFYVTAQDIGIHYAPCPGGVCGDEDIFDPSSKNHLFLSADANGAYFMLPSEAGGTALDLWKCGPAAPCTPTQVGNPFYAVAKVLAYGGKIHVLTTGNEGFLNGYITTCVAPDCTTVDTPISKIPYPSDFAVDANGYYWISIDNDTLETCPLTGCPAGGPRVLAPQQGQGTSLLTDDRFVYWMSGAGTSNGTIFRVAK